MVWLGLGAVAAFLQTISATSFFITHTPRPYPQALHTHKHTGLRTNPNTTTTTTAPFSSYAASFSSSYSLPQHHHARRRQRHLQHVLLLAWASMLQSLEGCFHALFDALTALLAWMHELLWPSVVVFDGGRRVR